LQDHREISQHFNTSYKTSYACVIITFQFETGTRIFLPDTFFHCHHSLYYSSLSSVPLLISFDVRSFLNKYYHKSVFKGSSILCPCPFSSMGKRNRGRSQILLPNLFVPAPSAITVLIDQVVCMLLSKGETLISKLLKSTFKLRYSLFIGIVMKIRTLQIPDRNDTML
jgi:hypothetical protein